MQKKKVFFISMKLNLFKTYILVDHSGVISSLIYATVSETNIVKKGYHL